VLVEMVSAPAVAPSFAPRALVRVGAGAARRSFWVRESAGVVLLTRIIAPHGTVASITAEVPGVAGVGVDTRSGSSPMNACRRAGPVDVCTRGQEWCPMPAARWRVTLTKRFGPAGVIRFVFRVGAPPATGSG
jgi:hypothetical protein